MRDDIFRVFIGLWVLLGGAGFLFFLFSKNAPFKRKYFPWFAGLSGLIFIGIVTATAISLALLAIMIPLVALITYLNIRGTQFCGACGRTMIQQMPFSRADFCSRCGAPLRDKRNGPRGT